VDKAGYPLKRKNEHIPSDQTRTQNPALPIHNRRREHATTRIARHRRG